MVPPAPQFDGLLSRDLRAGSWGSIWASISIGDPLPSGHGREGLRASRKSGGGSGEEVA